MDKMKIPLGIFPALVAVATCMAIPASADAATITVDSVVQRWPWNNKVDITYTVDGGQTRSAGVYCGLRFALTAGGSTYGFEGYTVGASAENGTHTITWTAPKGIVAADCTMTATLFTTNVPSGNDYMIVDLDNGNVIYEGLYASQGESNTRYNTDSFKRDKMVLRKVPRTADSATLPNGPFAGGYSIGDDYNYANSGNNANSSRTWTTDRDYYIGVFPVTQYQYAKIGADAGSSPSRYTGDNRRPVEQVSWNDLRRPTGDSGNFASTSSIPAVASAGTGTFFQRLNFLTGNTLGFDLPTEVMFEIAERAGATTYFFWGNDTNSIPDYAICKENSGNGSATVTVGSRLPNNWGLYDTAGNVWEWSLDDVVNGDLVARTSVFTPAWSNGTDRRHRGGGHFGASWLTTSEAKRFHASNRNVAEASTSHGSRGFRVASIAK